MRFEFQGDGFLVEAEELPQAFFARTTATGTAVAPARSPLNVSAATDQESRGRHPEKVSGSDEPRLVLSDLSVAGDPTDRFPDIYHSDFPPSAGVPARRLVIDDSFQIEIERATVHSLSPDGRRVLGQSNAEIVVYDLESRQVTARIPSAGGLRDPTSVAWSPDSSRVAFTSNFFIFLHEPDLLVVDLESLTLRSITDDGADRVAMPISATPEAPLDVTPVWLADSRTLLFQRMAGEGALSAAFATVSDIGGEVAQETEVLTTVPSIVDLHLDFFTGRIYYTNIVVPASNRDGGLWSLSPGDVSPHQFYSNPGGSRGIAVIQQVSYARDYALVAFPEMLAGRGAGRTGDEPTALAPLAIYDASENRIVELPDPDEHRIYRNATLSPDGAKMLYIFEDSRGTVVAVRDVFRQNTGGSVGSSIVVGDEVILQVTDEPSLGISPSVPLNRIDGLDWAANDRVLAYLDGANGHMKVIAASEFKAKCLAIIDEVGESGARIVISERGKPVAELIHYVELEEGYAQGALKGTAHIAGDIEAPAVAHSDWKNSSPS